MGLWQNRLEGEQNFPQAQSNYRQRVTETKQLKSTAPDWSGDS